MPQRLRPFLALLLVAAAACSSDFQHDESFVWGRLAAGAGGYAVGWIGSGGPGWNTYPGTSPENWPYKFSSPGRVFACGNGDLFVADTQNHRVCWWTSAGELNGWIGGGSSGWKLYNGPASGAGSDLESFSAPRSVFVQGGFIYVADTGNHRVAKWSLSGRAEGWIGGGESGWSTGPAPASGYSDTFSFSAPCDLCVADNGDLFVADTQNHRVCRWNHRGEADGWIGGGYGWNTGVGAMSGTALGYFHAPEGLAFDPLDGRLYVADTHNRRVVRWDVPSGTAEAWIGDGENWNTGDAPAGGSAFDAFDTPSGVSLARIDGSAFLFVSDRGNHRVCRWKLEGLPAGWLGDATDGWHLSEGAAASDDPKALNQPGGLSAADNGRVFAADTLNHRVCQWSSGSLTPAAWDTAPPAAVTDLAAQPGPGTGEVTLTFTATGDDDVTGRAAACVVRWDIQPLDETNWDGAQLFLHGQQPQEGGSAESLVVTGLASGTVHYFAIKVADRASNLSPLSITASATPP